MSVPLHKNKPSGAPCPHPRRGFHRWPFRIGSGFHVVEWCPTCNQNCRGPAVWVNRAEAIALGLNPDELPIVPGKAKGAEPSLFDRGGLS